MVALLGRPNAGKSTLLNALLGEKLAITSPRAQTTRGRLLGVLTRPGAQIVFIDTPGVNRGRSRFNLAMTETALAAAEDADLRLLLLDTSARWDEPEAHSRKQIVQIASSMKEFGFTNPVLVDANDCIIAGHGRVKAAALLGLTGVPTILLDDLTQDRFMLVTR